MAQGIRNPLHLGLPQRLRKARKLARLGPTALAARAGLSPKVGPAIEAGAVPRLDALEALAQVLQVEPGWLAYARPREPLRRLPDGDGTQAQHRGAGARLRAARDEAGLSARALGRDSGTSDTAVRTIEAGAVVPGLDTVERLADALGVSPRWLAFGEGGAGSAPGGGRSRGAPSDRAPG